MTFRCLYHDRIIDLAPSDDEESRALDSLEPDGPHAALTCSYLAALSELTDIQAMVLA